MNREKYEEMYNEMHQKCTNCQEWDTFCECIVCDVCEELFQDIYGNSDCYKCRETDKQ